MNIIQTITLCFVKIWGKNAGEPPLHIMMSMQPSKRLRRKQGVDTNKGSVMVNRRIKWENYQHNF